MTYTFAQHQALASTWCQWNGQRGTEKQSLRVMRDTTAPDLVRLLTERGVTLPLGVPEAAHAEA